MSGTETCAAVLWLGPCGLPAVASLRAMCVHEHLRDGYVCNFHAKQWAEGYRPECGACADGPDRHSCALTEVAPAVAL